VDRRFGLAFRPLLHVLEVLPQRLDPTRLRFLLVTGQFLDALCERFELLLDPLLCRLACPFQVVPRVGEVLVHICPYAEVE